MGSIMDKVTEMIGVKEKLADKAVQESAPEPEAESTPAASEGGGEASAETTGGGSEGGGEGEERRRRRQLRAMSQPNESLFSVLGSSQGGRSRLG